MVLEFLGVEDAWNTLVVLGHWESHIHREVFLQAPGDVTRHSCLSSQIGAIQLRQGFINLLLHAEIALETVQVVIESIGLHAGVVVGLTIRDVVLGVGVVVSDVVGVLSVLEDGHILDFGPLGDF